MLGQGHEASCGDLMMLGATSGVTRPLVKTFSGFINFLLENSNPLVEENESPFEGDEYLVEESGCKRFRICKFSGWSRAICFEF